MPSLFRKSKYCLKYPGSYIGVYKHNTKYAKEYSSKQFCWKLCWPLHWVYHFQKSQLKRTIFVSAVLLSLFGSSNVFPMQIWDSFLTSHLSSKESQTLPFFGALWWIYLFQQLFELFRWESITSSWVKNI